MLLTLSYRDIFTEITRYLEGFEPSPFPSTGNVLLRAYADYTKIFAVTMGIKPTTVLPPRSDNPLNLSLFAVTIVLSRGFEPQSRSSKPRVLPLDEDRVCMGDRARTCIRC